MSALPWPAPGGLVWNQRAANRRPSDRSPAVLAMNICSESLVPSSVMYAVFWSGMT